MRNKLILIIIAVSVIISLIGFWYYQRNIYSKEVLKLEILASSEAGFAEETEYVVKYKNNGNIRLEEPRLVFEYPENSIVGEGKLREEVVLGDIYPGKEDSVIFKARLLGSEGEVKKARAWLSYRPKGLKARYESETSHIAKIKSVPITLEFDLPSKIDSGGELGFKLNYFSNVNYPLSNLGIKLEYPADFEFLKAKPQSLDQSQWEIGLLNKAEGGRIEITGNLRGKVEEEKIFRAQLGVWQNGEFVSIKESIRAVRIVTSSLYISQQINSNPQYAASPGDNLHYEILFKNIGEESFNNLFLVVKLEGKLFDFQTLKAPLGEFEPGDNSIIFDWRRISELQFLDAQEEGRVEFWIELKKDAGAVTPQDFNPVIRNKVYLSQARQEFINKVNTKLEINQKVYYENEVFGEEGPIPPEVGRTTKYVVNWQIKDYYNDVKNVKVKAVLGKGVSLTGKIFSDDAKLTFDSQSREVVWDLGDMEAGKGVLSSSPSVTFQIALMPLASQKGETLELIGKSVITGEDQFTNRTVSGEASAINIEGVVQ